jgi:hypothetical protein
MMMEAANLVGPDSVSRGLRGDRSWSFANKGVPKLELGHEGREEVDEIKKSVPPVGDALIAVCYQYDAKALFLLIWNGW